MVKKNIAEEIKSWREVLVQLDDQKFFELIRVYLGKIETPFNKQKLIERLSAFLRRPQVKEKIVNSLDSVDIVVVTAISFLPVPNEDILHAFFRDDYSYSTLYEKLRNLEERLILYKKHTQLDGHVYKINPHLAPEILKTINIDIFRLPEKLGKPKHTGLLIDNIKIAGVYSFLVHNKDMLKLNGEIKKKHLKKFYSVFPDFIEYKNSINYLLYAFLNLGLFIRTDTGLLPNKKKWESFATLSPYETKSYLTVAATGKFQKKFLHSKADKFYKFVSSLDPSGEYRKKDLEKTFFLCLENTKINFTKTETTLIPDVNEFYLGENKNISIIDIAVIFGIFYEKNGLLTVNGGLKNDETLSKEPILISPAFEVTIFPGTELSSLLTILLAMEPISIQTTGIFEINRKVAGVCFQKNITGQKLCKVLKTESAEKLPQNVEVSIMQWYESISSIQLYTGVVAIVSSEKQNVFEKSMPLSEIVQHKISDGIYLLKDNPYEQIKAARLEFLLREQKKCEPFSQIKFEPISSYNEKEKIISTKVQWQKEFKKNQQKHFENFEELKAEVNTLDLSKDEKQGMLDAIKRRVIIDKTQIKKANIQNNQTEISGLDFLGKIRICEKAINQKSMLEISLSDKGSVQNILCTPLKIIRGEKNAFLTASIEPENKVDQISVAHISKIKVLKNSIFS